MVCKGGDECRSDRVWLVMHRLDGNNRCSMLIQGINQLGN